MTQRAAASGATDSGTEHPGDRFLYTYAIARPSRPDPTAGLRGVADCPVRTVPAAGLLAVVSDVPARDFGEAALREQLEDLGRLEELARAHHAVVDAVAARTGVLPLRLATVYRDESGVREVLRERSFVFRSALEAVESRREWGVKVYTSTPGDTSAPAMPASSGSPPTSPSSLSGRSSPAGGPSARPGPGATTGRAPSPAGSGRAYLQDRLRARREREEGWRRATELSRRVDAELSAIADEVRHHRPQDPRLSGVQGENVLNAAYLVRRDREEEFTAMVRELGEGESGVRVELTGPWAPYSFALVQRAGGPAADGPPAQVRAGGEEAEGAR